MSDTRKANSLGAKPEICLIDENNFEAVILQERNPVLLLCMPRDDHFRQQIDVVTNAVANYDGPLKVGLLNESFISLFKKRYRVPGTPTFLILLAGREKNRSLGLTDEPTLAALIRDACPALPDVS